MGIFDSSSTYVTPIDKYKGVRVPQVIEYYEGDVPIYDKNGVFIGSYTP
jgi:hypothetical protein